jgi:4-hydroxy-tetrahydrodipicolinate synthase
MPFFHALFIETSPGPVKEALYHMGMMEKGIRSPLCGLTGENSSFLKELLKEQGLFRRD